MKTKMMKKKFILKNILKVDNSKYAKYRKRKLTRYFYLNNMYDFMKIRLNIMKKRYYYFFIKHFIFLNCMYRDILKFFLKSYIYSSIYKDEINLIHDENISKKYLFKNNTTNIFLYKNLKFNYSNKASSIGFYKNSNVYFNNFFDNTDILETFKLFDYSYQNNYINEYLNTYQH